jgi:GT2 family glycosyltransferase
MPKLRQGLVSIVLVNFRGADDTLQAIEQLELLDWPRELLEIVVVENGSGDDSVRRLKAVAGRVKLVVSKENLGFAGGCNLGVKASSGEFVGFLNNDARPDAAWVKAAIARFAQSDRIAAVASRVLDWDGKLVDYVGSALTWFGMGYKPFTSEPFEASMSKAGDVLFGTGSAMFVRRRIFDELAGFDERYFMFFEDVDLGWRLNLLGWRFFYEPDSLAFHKHHASMTSFGAFKENYLLERNALFTLYKNVEQSTLNEALPAAMALAVRRGIARGHVDSTSLDLRKAGGNEESAIPTSKETLAPVFAIDQFVAALPGLRESRDAVQAGRVVSDQHLWRLFGLTDMPAFKDKYYRKGYENVVTTFDLLSEPQVTNVLVITGDPIGAKLAGPAIRAWNIAEALARKSSVKLVSLSGIEEVEATFGVLHVRPGDEREMQKLERWADVIIFQGHAMAVFDTIRNSAKILVVDLYDPMHLEQLEQGRELPADQWDRQVRDANATLNEQMLRGDFFLCASERQRLFWLGQLASLGRINPSTYAGDPDLEGLISVVPFGLSSIPPRHEEDVLKGVQPGIAAEDKLVLWSGGLYNWFDPETLIRAVVDLNERRGNVRLFFQGTKHPHPGVPEMGIVARSRSLARELDALDVSVFFNSSWVDYDQRQNYLTEADAGVSTHFAHIETTFSFRTRVLDYLWAELPMVVTAGDHFADLIEAETLGIVVAAGDVEGLSAALERVLFDDAFIAKARNNIRRIRKTYFWDDALAPLVWFVTDAHHAGDKLGLATETAKGEPRRRPAQKRSGFRHDLALVAKYARSGGIRVVAHKIRNRLRRR